jgi:dephospho-CoA kinase
LGITGGIAMGKTTAAELLQQHGAVVVDTDRLAGAVVEPGQPALAEIRRAFGQGVIGEDGKLRRAELAELVFEDAAARARLEAIVHPRITELWQAEVQTWRRENCSVGAVVIPLLFETGAASQFDATICVACTLAAQAQRLAARGWSRQQSEKRIQAQWPVEKKVLLSDYLVWSEGGLEVMREQLRRILQACVGGLEGCPGKRPAAALEWRRLE